jgi:O-antigen/teichoic acid export membrane protein
MTLGEVEQTDEFSSVAAGDVARTKDDIARVAKGGGFLFGGSLFEYVARFGIAFLLADITGADGYGQYTLAISVGATLTGLASLGLDDTMVRYVAILRGRMDREGLAGAIVLGLGASFLTGVLAAFGLWLLAPTIAVDIFNDEELTSMLRVIAVAMPSLTLSNALLGCIRGSGRMDYAALSESTIQTGVRLGSLAILAAIGGLDPFVAIVVFAISDVVSSVSMFYFLDRTLDLRTLLARPRRTDFRELLTFAMPLWFAGVMNSVRRNIATFMLGSLETSTQVGLLSIVGRINLLARLGYRSVIVGVKPVLARMHDEGNRSGLAVLYRTSTRWTLNMNLPFFVFVTLHSREILGVLGDEFEVASRALIVMAAVELVIGGTGICGSIIDMTRHLRTKMINPVLLAIVVIAANLLLIPPFGLMGAAFAALIAAVFINFLRLAEVWFLEGLQPYDRTYWKSFGAAGASGIVGFGLARLPLDGPIWLLIQAVVISGGFAGSLTAFGLSDADQLVLGRLKKRLQKVARPRKAKRTSVENGSKK